MKLMTAIHTEVTSDVKIAQRLSLAMQLTAAFIMIGSLASSVAIGLNLMVVPGSDVLLQSNGPVIYLDAATVGAGPYYLHLTGATYVLTEDISTPGTAIVFASQNVTLDLNQHTVTFGTSSSPYRYGVALPPSYADTNGLWVNSDITVWRNSSGGVVKNGTIVQGSGRGANSAAFISYAEDNITLQDTTITVNGDDTFAARIEYGGTFHVSGNTITDNTTVVTNRSQGRASIDFINISTEAALEVFNNTINNSRQWGIRVARGDTAGTWGHIYNNSIYPNTIVTNGYGIGVHGGRLEVYDNTIHATNGRGVHIEGNNAKVHDNDIDVVELPSSEYPRVSAHGIKLEGSTNADIYSNTVLSKGIVVSDSQTSIGAALDFTVAVGSNNFVHNNTFTARHLGGPGFTSGDYNTTYATAIQAIQSGNIDGDTGLRIEDNTFITNDRFFSSTEWVMVDGNPPDRVIDAQTLSLARNTLIREPTALSVLGKDVTFFQSSVSGLRFVDNAGGDFRNVGAGWDYSLNSWSAAHSGTVKLLNVDATPAAGVVVEAKNAQNVVSTATTDGQGTATFILDEFSGSITNTPQLVEKNPYQITALFPSGSKSQPATINSNNWQLTLQDGAAADTASPAAIANLATTGSTAVSVGLSWTAPGDDGSSGTATAYDVRYALSPITAGNFTSAVQVAGEPTPAAAGSPQSMSVSGLSVATTYYFAIKTRDEVLNTSGISNGISATTALPPPADTTPPAAIINLAATALTTSSVSLSWTAPGDDGAAGTATEYDLRSSVLTISAGNFDTATVVYGEPTPTAAGGTQTMTVNGLSAGTTYSFAMKTSDEVPNTSALSNVAQATTTALPAEQTCVPDWQCGTWSACTDGRQLRHCGDQNRCVSSQPVEYDETRTCLAAGGPDDTVAPDTGSLTVDPIVYTNVVRLALSGSDDQTRATNVRFHYRLDGGPTAMVPVGSTLTLRQLSNGAHTVAVQAIDEAGNTDPTPTTVSFTVRNVLSIVVGKSGRTSTDIRTFDYQGKQRTKFTAFRGLKTGVNVAVLDRGGDGVGEIAAVPGRGGPPEVRIFSAQGKLRKTFLAYPKGFSGGVNLAVADVNGDGLDEIIAAPASGVGSYVRVFDADGKLLAQRNAFASTFRGGVSVAAGTLNAAEPAHILTAAASGGTAEVSEYKFANGQLTLVRRSRPFGNLKNVGVALALGNVDGKGAGEIVASLRRGSRSTVGVFQSNGRRLATLATGKASASTQWFVASGDLLRFDRRDEVVVVDAQPIRAKVQEFSLGTALRATSNVAAFFPLGKERSGLSVAVGHL